MEDEEFSTVSGLLKPIEQAETKAVTLPSGARVLVRGLTRQELLDGGKGTDDNALIEARMTSYALVRPAMTLAQVQQWQKAPGSIADFAELSIAYRDLSGLGPGADKSNMDEAGD